MTFSLIGEKLSHSMSPFIHNYLFKLRNLHFKYDLVEIEKSCFKEIFQKKLETSCGMNVTIPYKQSVIPFLDRLDGRAEIFKSVNTIKIGDKAVGYNTDCDGFLKALALAQIPISGDVFILGAGGVARTFAFECALKNAYVTIVCRDTRSGFAIKDEIIAYHSDSKIDVIDFEQLEASDSAIDLLINATPLGMHPKINISPASAQVVSRSKHIFDSIYNPHETALIQLGNAAGAVTLGGMSMLVWQAEMAQRIWFGTNAADDEIERLIHLANREMKEIFR